MRPHIGRRGGVTGDIMSTPLTVSIPHRLDKEEAVHRLKSGIGGARTNYGLLFAVGEETWTGNHLLFRVRALGQEASGTIDVAEEYVTLQASPPRLFAPTAPAIQPLPPKEDPLLLATQ